MSDDIYHGMGVSHDMIPREVKDDIDRIFPGSEGRRKIAYALMFWNRKPTTQEYKELASWAGLKAITSGQKVMRRLKEEGLFTDKVGSVPLAKSLIDLSVLHERPQASTPPAPPTPPIHPDPRELPLQEGGLTRQNTPEDTPFTPSKPVYGPRGNPDELPITPMVRDVVKDVNDRLTSAEEEIRLLKKGLDAEFADLKSMLGDLKNPLQGAPMQQVSPLSVQNNPKEDPTPPPQEAGGDESDLGPFADMSKRELVDLAMNDPDQIYAMRTGRRRRDDTIQAMPDTMRWMGIMLTTYTQNAFERSVQDGYEGTLSDFINDCVYQYFADRGKVLQWVDMPDPRRDGWPHPRRRDM